MFVRYAGKMDDPEFFRRWLVSKIKRPEWEAEEITDADFVGAGSCSAVVAHQSSQDGKKYAAKVWNPTVKNAHMLFLKEIRLLDDFNHDNIVPLIAFNADKKIIFMEYLSFTWSSVGIKDEENTSDLSDYMRVMRERNIIGLCDLKHCFPATVARQVAAGLAYLHQNTVSHRDMKPENILLGDSSSDSGELPFVCKIADYSESRKMDIATTPPEEKQTGRHRGSPLYMAPEILPGAQVDGGYARLSPVELERADVWGFGMILFTLLHPELAHPYSNHEAEEEVADPETLATLMWEEQLPRWEVSARFQKYGQVEEAARAAIKVNRELRASMTELTDLLEI